MASAHFPQARPVDGFAEFLIAPREDLHTEILYSAEGLIPTGSRGVVLLFPGTSSRMDSEYGVARALAPLAQHFRRDGYAVLAFQPPIYHRWREGLDARAEFLEKYSSPEANIEWLGNIVRFVRAHTALPLRYYGRSTFADMGLEAYHRAAQGHPSADFVGEFSHMFLPGLEGTTEQAISVWHTAEVDFFKSHPHKGDMPVVLAGPRLFRQFDWEKTRAPVSAALAERLPEVLLACGIADEFCGARPSALVAPAAAFLRQHPGGNFTFVLHDGYHNPAQLKPNESEADRQARVRAIHGAFLAEKPFRGFRVLYAPDRQSVLSASPKNRHPRIEGQHREYDRCQTLIRDMGAAQVLGSAQPLVKDSSGVETVVNS